MKFSTEELLLAAAVRDRVSEMRVTQANNLPPEERANFWKQPVNSFIEEAMEELEGIASVIAMRTDR